MTRYCPRTLIATTAQKLFSRYQDEELCTQYAWWMLESITQKPVALLMVTPTIELTHDQLIALTHAIEQQVLHEMPLAYVLKTVPFLNLTLHVEPPILIPRHETEEWVANLIAKLTTLENQNLSILDIGTGSGCIALALAQALPQATIYAVDINPQALALGQKNATNNALSNVQFIHSDLFQNITAGQKFNLIVSNPPYLGAQELDQVDSSLAKWEDIGALVADDDGLALIKKIINQAPDYVLDTKEFTNKDIPQLWIEIGYLQGEHVKDFMQQTSLFAAQVHKDMQGNDRLVTGKVIR